MYPFFSVFILALVLQVYGPPTQITTIKNEDINESSGLVASHTSPGAYWTHNDSGDGPFIYAINTRGESLGTFRVSGAANRDWEDIAAGPGPQGNRSYLYIGDIGDNDSVRNEIVVYRVPEPQLTPADKNSSREHPRTTEPAEAIRLAYPDGKHDAEALLVHPSSGNLYVITKTPFGKPGVYQALAPLTSGKLIVMTHIADLQTPSLLGGIITGGSIAPDGRSLVLCDYFQGFEMTLPSTVKRFDDIWKQKLVSFDLGKRKQGESIAYRLDGNAVLATSEGKLSPLIQVDLGRRRSRM